MKEIEEIYKQLNLDEDKETQIVKTSLRSNYGDVLIKI